MGSELGAWVPASTVVASRYASRRSAGSSRIRCVATVPYSYSTRMRLKFRSKDMRLGAVPGTVAVAAAEGAFVQRHLLFRFAGD